MCYFSSVIVLVFWLIVGTLNESAKDGVLVGTGSSQKILLSLLDGRLLSVDVNTGSLLWSLQEDPILSMPADKTTRLNFFPNPKDGSLYFYSKIKENVERLPLTIPELVQISPTKSTDGLLYTAMKSDVWLEIDPHSGTKLHTISSESVVSAYCPALETHLGTIFISRTAYTLSVYDSDTKEKRWDATYQEYNSYSYPSNAHTDRLYFSSTTDGIFVSINPLTGDELWRVSYDSPVVAVFAIEGWQLRKIPLYTVAVESIDLLRKSSALALCANTAGSKVVDTSVQTSLFIGFHQRLVYAVDCFADEGLLTVNFDSTVLPLLEGPQSGAHQPSHAGHYNSPETSLIQYQSVSVKGNNKPDFREIIMKASKHSSTKYEVKRDADTIGSYSQNVDNTLVSIVMILVSGAVAALISWLCTKTALAHTTKPLRSPNTEDAEASIGKIKYCTQKVLGRGSHGTVVFKGTFDKRPVAVKRILPECYGMAEHEVELLRQSDKHPNVIRYYCTEEDSVFRYIALELCKTTLHEYIESGEVRELSCYKSILTQAVRGLGHLHHLGIVHRDIKPRNVLLTDSTDGGARAMISDFGLCRILPNNRHSYTANSGVSGTDGWIAPEVFNQDGKVTCAADIFSLGCVVFFVLSLGRHPFGPCIKRQANIASGDYDLSKLGGVEKYVAEDLIKKMISNNCRARPSSNEVLSHCFFWSENKQLNFFLDVSDRVEKEPMSSRLVQGMESGASVVVGNDWREHITEDLRTDLRRFRSYHGHSVRDLLRALRNKKHHYSELPRNLKESIGEIPNGFVVYFTSRFPRLLIHLYNKMETFRSEPVLMQYYS